MRSIKCFWWLLILGVGCSPAMMVDDHLQHDTQTFTVEGRQGWLINQKLSFGPYRSDQVKRGWTFSYEFPFLLHLKGAREKLQFQLNDGDHWARVFCLGKVTQRELPLLEELFRVSLKDNNIFAGAIVTDYSATPWQFLIQKNYNNLPARDFTGILRNGDTRIDLREVQRTAQESAPWGEPLGYEFVLGDEVIGAVEVLNRGRVILSSTVSDELKMLLAGTSAALLLRSELSETLGHNQPTLSSRGLDVALSLLAEVRAGRLSQEVIPALTACKLIERFLRCLSVCSSG